MTKFSPEDIFRLASLARLRVDVDAADGLAQNLTEIIAYSKVLDEVQCSSSPPVLDNQALRDDVVQPSIDRASLLAEAPRHTKEGFLVPRVVG